jgi:hypothetical protein
LKKYHSQREELEKNLFGGYLEGKEEEEYHANYNPTFRRDSYHHTFLKIKKKAWIQLKKNYTTDLETDQRNL